MGIKVLFEDDYILVVDKSANLVVTRSETQSGKTLEEILKEDFKISLYRGGVVHRLDKDTSGILVVAKTQKSLDYLQSQFKKRTVKKMYLALVHKGIEKEGNISGAIERNPKNREKFAVLEAGKEAQTNYLPVEKLYLPQDKLDLIFPEFSSIQMRKLKALNYQQFTLLKCFPLTGRTHQIRVHLKYINHPIVSDEKYGGRKMVRLDKRWCPRQFLHAQRIEFSHPGSGDKMIFESKLPDDLAGALSFFKGYG